MTRMVTNLVAPSPSRTTRVERSMAKEVNIFSNAAYASESLDEIS